MTAAQPSAHSHPYLDMLRDIATVSESCGTPSYLWGGLAIDALEGRFCREHGDVDAMTLGLWEKRKDLTRAYRARGYVVSTLDAFEILRIDRDGLHAGFNPVNIADGTAYWRHVGPQGTIRFPATWLTADPVALCGVPVRCVSAALLYAFKACPALLNPAWHARAKDEADLARLKRLIHGLGLTPDDILRRVWTDTPFWSHRGYTQYSRALCGAELINPPSEAE